MEAISLFEWSTSISKCKCSHFEWSTSISKCKNVVILDGQLLYPNANAVIWMVNLYIQMQMQSFEWSTSISKCQCYLNGQLL